MYKIVVSVLVLAGFLFVTGCAGTFVKPNVDKPNGSMRMMDSTSI